MSFKDGEQSEVECPKCGNPLLFEMSFKDRYSYSTGHYTVDYPILACPNCDYTQEYEGDDYDGE